MTSNKIKLQVAQDHNFSSHDQSSKSNRIILKRQSTLKREISLKNVNSKVTFHETKATSPCETDQDASIDREVFSHRNKRILPISLISSPRTSLPTSVAQIRNFPTTVPSSPSHFMGDAKVLKHRSSIDKSRESSNKGLSYKLNSINNLNNLDIRDDMSSKSPDSRTLQNYGFITQRPKQFQDYFEYSPIQSRQKSRNNSQSSRSNPRTINDIQSRPLKLNEGGIEESGYEKTPKIADQNAKLFQNKISKLDSAASRKSSLGSQNLRKEFLKSDSNIMRHASLLKERQHSQILNLKLEDEGLFNKITQIFNEGINELESNTTNHGEKELFEEKDNLLQVTKYNYSFCFITVKGKPCPLTISFQCPKNIKRIKVFVSTTIQKPINLNCDYERDTRVIKLYDKDRKARKFSNSYFYFGLHADESGTILSKVEFSPEFKSRSPRSKVTQIKPFSRKKTLNLDNLDIDIRTFEKEIEDIKKERREKILKMAAGVNKVLENKRTEQFSPSRATQRKEALRLKSEEQLRIVQLRKSEREKEKIDIRMAHIIRHDVQKMMKELANEENRREILSKFRLQSWYMMIVLTNIGQTVKVALEKQRKIRQKQKRMTFLLKKFLYKIKSNLLKKAPNKGIRSTIDLRLALQYHSNIIKLNREKDAEDIIGQFMQALKEARLIQNKFIFKFKAIKKAQKTWREFRQRKNAFQTCMLMLWENNYKKVFDEQIHESPKFKNSTKVLITQIAKHTPAKVFNFIEFKTDEKGKKKFVKIWMRRCYERFKKNYSIHRTEYQNISDEVKKQWMLHNLFKSPEDREKETPRYHLFHKMPKHILMVEFEKNKMIPTDYNSKNMTEFEKLTPPRLFVLPNQMEIEKLLKEIIEIQKNKRSLSYLQ